ncbi:MAG: DUF6268 family outer membrane beta-barrel protein [Flavobacteriales bacterium]
MAKIGYAVTPFNNYDSLNGISTQIQEFSTDITLPIVLDSSKSIITGVLFEQISLVNQPANQSTFYTINPKIGINIKHSKKISGTYVLLPKISSDLTNGLTSKDFQFGGLGLIQIKKSSQFKYKFGAYYNQELFGPFLVPLLGFYYQSKNKKFEANFTLPVSADANYQVVKNIKTGLNFNAFVKSFYVPQFNNNYITKTTNELFAYLQFNFPSYRILIEPQIGYSVDRSYRIYNTSDKLDFKLSAFKFGPDQKPLNFDFDDGLIFKVRLVYRFMLENN